MALVALETTPRFLTRAQIANAVAVATGRPYPVESVIEEMPEKHRFTVEGYELTFVARFGPYIPKDRNPSKDLRLQSVLDRHESALLLDCWSAPEGKVREDSTDLMGKILIEIADETTVGVFCFHTQRLNPMDETLVEMLQEGRAGEAMNTYTADGVSNVAADDERMIQAIDEARRRWPEFVAAFNNRQAPDSGFGFKAPFEQGDRVEHLWVEVEQIDDEGATGKVVSRPVALARPRNGDTVTVGRNEISDWAYQDGERTGGSFTDAIVRGALNS